MNTHTHGYVCPPSQALHMQSLATIVQVDISQMSNMKIYKQRHAKKRN